MTHTPHLRLHSRRLERAHLPAPVAAPATVRVALAGCGVVGGALTRLLAEQRAAIAARSGLHFELVRVLVANPARERDVPVAHALFTSDVDEFLATPSDIVVEAIGGVDPGLRIARAALGEARAFVTANKTLIAAHGPELAALARRGGGHLDFESAVGGALPVVRILRDSLGGAGVTRVRGIVNGTSNYILTRVAEGMPFVRALASAQERGFAEADPTRDLDGQDAADKIAILAWLAFGVDPREAVRHRRGILPDPDALVRLAHAVGGEPRLLAESVVQSAGVTTLVEPVIVEPRSTLGAVRDEENLVEIESDSSSAIRVGGKGAGGAPTAAAMLADLIGGAAPLATHSARATAVDDARVHRWLVHADARSLVQLRRVCDAARVPTAIVTARDAVVLSLDAPRAALPPLVDGLPGDSRLVYARWEEGPRGATG